MRATFHPFAFKICRFPVTRPISISLWSLFALLLDNAQAQPTYSSNTTITSAVTLAEDISITNSASLSISSGGNLSIGANEVFVGGTEFATGVGTLSITSGGDLSNRTGYVGFFANSNGTASISGAGSSWSNTGSLMIGRNGGGTLSIDNGATASSQFGYLGYSLGSSGSATLSGSGSAWNLSSTLFVGRAGTGSLSAQVGAGGSSGAIELGSQSSGHGTLTVSGSSTAWTSQSITVGSSGTGAVNISQGAALTATTYPSSIGSQTGSTGTVSVSGANSSWATNNLYVGANGHGIATISGGGTISSTEFVSGYTAASIVGFYPGSSGEVSVAGEGSTWNLREQLYIAYEGDGVVTVSDGGKLAFVNANSSITLGDQVVGEGTLNIGAAANAAPAGVGTVGAASIRGGSGTGVLQFNTTANTSAPLYFTQNGTASGTGVNTSGGLRLVHTAGHTVFKGTLAHTGPTEINGGILALTGTLSGSSVTVASGATLDGIGTLNAPVTLANGGRLGSSASVGTLTFASGLSFAGSAELNLQLGTTGDLIRVTGGTLSASPASTITIKITDAGGFGAGIYTFMDATGANLSSIGATTFEIGSFVGGYTYQISQAGNLFQIVATAAVPEPSSAALALAAVALCRAAARRRRSPFSQS